MTEFLEHFQVLDVGCWSWSALLAWEQSLVCMDFCHLLWCMLCLNTAWRTEELLRFMSLFSTEWNPKGLTRWPPSGTLTSPSPHHQKEDQTHPMPSSGQPPPNSTTLASKGTTKAGLTPDSPYTGYDTWKEFSDGPKVPKWTFLFPAVPRVHFY